MNLHQIDLVQTTFALVHAEANLFVTQLYNHLFRLDPCLCYLLPQEMEAHNKEFMLILAEIVDGLSRPYLLIHNTLKPLGHQYAASNIRPTHYHTFATALRLALANILGPAFTTEVEAAWMDAYYLVIGVIKETRK